MKARRKNLTSTPQRSSNPAHYSLISTNPNKNLSLDQFSFKCIYFSLSELFKASNDFFYLLSNLFKPYSNFRESSNKKKKRVQREGENEIRPAIWSRSRGRGPAVV